MFKPINLISGTKTPNQWSPVKYSGNPVLNGFDGSGSTSTTQSYPPGIFLDDDGKYYCLADSGDANIVSFSSDDGKTFTKESVTLQTGSSGSWDESSISDAWIRKNGSTYYLIYACLSNTTNQINCGYATSSSPISGYTKFGSNPILTCATYNAFFGGKVDRLVLYDVVKVDSIYYWFGIAFDASRSEIFLATANSWMGDLTLVKVLFKACDSDVTKNSILGCSVFKESWGWVMTFNTMNRAFGTRGQSNIRCAFCTDFIPNNFTCIDQVLLDVGANGSWEQDKVYIGRWLKKSTDDSFQDLIQVSGKYRLYYAGEGDIGQNQGLSGLAEYDSIPNFTRGSRPTTIPFTYNSVIENVSGLVAWGDVNEQTYYPYDNKITQINNKANKYFPLVGTHTTRPSYVSNVINGYPVARFNGTTQYLSYGYDLGNVASYTYFIVCSCADITTEMYLCGGSDSTGTNVSAYAQLGANKGDNGNIIVTYGNDTNYTNNKVTSQILTNDTPVLITIKYNTGDNFTSIYKNGVLQNTSQSSKVVTSSGSTIRNFSIGRPGDYNGAYWKGDIALFAMWNRALNDTERTTIESNLISRFTLNLDIQ